MHQNGLCILEEQEKDWSSWLYHSYALSKRIKAGPISRGQRSPKVNSFTKNLISGESNYWHLIAGLRIVRKSHRARLQNSRDITWYRKIVQPEKSFNYTNLSYSPNRQANYFYRSDNTGDQESGMKLHANATVSVFMTIVANAVKFVDRSWAKYDDCAILRSGAFLSKAESSH